MEVFLITKPWHTSEWREKRAEFIKGKNCSWCGSEERLAIHHTKTFRSKIERKKIIKKFLYQYFNDNENLKEKNELIARAKKQLLNKYIKICPECGFRVYYRKTKIPKYKCTKCRTETNNPKRKRSKLTFNKLNKKIHAIFYKKHKDEINNLYHLEKEKAKQDYLEFKDVIILCRKCHFAYHKGLKICNECKTYYHKQKHKKCWNCFQNDSMK